MTQTSCGDTRLCCAHRNDQSVRILFHSWSYKTCIIVACVQMQLCRFKTRIPILFKMSFNGHVQYDCGKLYGNESYFIEHGSAMIIQLIAVVVEGT